MQVVVKRFMLLMVGAAVGTMGADASAGVVVTSSERAVGAASGMETDVVGQPIPSLHQSTAVGTFDEVALSEFVDPIDNDPASGRASQTSFISGASFTASGEIVVSSTGEFGAAKSLYKVDFDVVTPQHYTLQYSLQTTTVGSFGGSDDAGTVVLSSAGSPIVGPDTVQLGVPLNTPDLKDNVSFNGSGVLNPGSYTLLLDLGFYGRYPNVDELDYSLSMTFRDAGSDNPAVPLPPAVWGGLMMLGGIAAGQYYRRRRALVEA